MLKFSGFKKSLCCHGNGKMPGNVLIFLDSGTPKYIVVVKFCIHIFNQIEIMAPELLFISFYKKQ